MPTVLNETIADFEFLVTGRADYPEVIFSGDDFNLINVPFGEGSGPLFLGDENTVALIDGVVDGGSRAAARALALC